MFNRSILYRVGAYILASCVLSIYVLWLGWQWGGLFGSFLAFLLQNLVAWPLMHFFGGYVMSWLWYGSFTELGSAKFNDAWSNMLLGKREGVVIKGWKHL